MSPLVVDESQVFSFKFWFSDTIQNGMYHRGELYCRLSSYDLKKRAQVYHLAYKLAQQDPLIVITVSTTTCSLWGSLRAPLVKNLLLDQTPLTLPGSGIVSTTLSALDEG